jgi:UDP-N-acetylmuramate--alanine ligase
VAESDESDGSFMALSPAIAVVTNVDLEHVDHYGSMENIRTAFVNFINKIPFYGTAILCMDNEEIQNIIPRVKKSYITYGKSAQSDIRARDTQKEGLTVDFEVIRHGSSLGRVVVGMPGDHSVLNALAAIAVGLEFDMDMGHIRKGLENLGGLERRFQVKGEKSGVILVDDYGHHPAEIAATLATAKECWPENRLVVIFQPHRYTRTRDLYERFVISFNQADLLIIAPIYAAGERPIEGVDSNWLYRGIKGHGHKDVYLGSNQDDILAILSSTVRKGDTVVTLGAGDIYRVGDEFFAGL